MEERGLTTINGSECPLCEVACKLAHLSRQIDSRTIDLPHARGAGRRGCLGPLRHRVVHRAQRQPARQRALSRPGSRRPARRSRPPPIADKARHVRPAHRYRPGRHAEEHAQLAARGSRPGRDQRASQRGCSPRRLHVSRRPLWSPESTVWRFRQDPAMRAGAGRGAVAEPGLKVVELERNLAARPARGGPTGCRRSCIPAQTGRGLRPRRWPGTTAWLLALGADGGVGWRAGGGLAGTASGAGQRTDDPTRRAGERASARATRARVPAASARRTCRARPSARRVPAAQRRARLVDRRAPTVMGGWPRLAPEPCVGVAGGGRACRGVGGWSGWSRRARRGKGWPSRGGWHRRSRRSRLPGR